MEWVETTGRTIAEAKDAALDQLGVDEHDAEFEILAEPKSGLFGRLREEARVRARVRPTSIEAAEVAGSPRARKLRDGGARGRKRRRPAERRGSGCHRSNVRSHREFAADGRGRQGDERGRADGRTG